MRVVPLALLAAVFAVPLNVAAQDKPFGYAPGTNRYKVTTVQHRQQIMGGGRAPFDFDVTTNQWLALTITPVNRDTVRLTVRVDSVAVAASLDAPSPDLAKYRGRTLNGTMSPSGYVYAFAPPAGTTDPALNQLYGAFRRFLIPVKPPTLAKGVSWSDTATIESHRAKIDVTTTTVTTYRVTGDTTVAGQHAWRVELSSTIANEGKGTEGGQPIMISGSGTSSGVHVLSDNGVFLGSQSTQRSDLQEHMKDSEGAPIEQTFKSTVELLK